MMRQAKRILALSFVLALASCGESPVAAKIGAPNDTLTIAYISALIGESFAWGIPEANTLRVFVD